MSDPSWVAVAVIEKFRGNRGEVFFELLTGDPERLVELPRVFLSKDGAAEGEERRIEKVWNHEGRWILKLSGCESIGEAELLRGQVLVVRKGDRPPLDPEAFYHEDLAGCELIDRKTGSSVGRVQRVLDSESGVWLELENEALVPFVRAICVKIDVAARRIEADLPEGLLELNRP